MLSSLVNVYNLLHAFSSVKPLKVAAINDFASHSEKTANGLRQKRILRASTCKVVKSKTKAVFAFEFIIPCRAIVLQAFSKCKCINFLSVIHFKW